MAFKLSEHHETPLHYASGQNLLEIAKYLIDNGADINAKDGIYT